MQSYKTKSAPSLDNKNILNTVLFRQFLSGKQKKVFFKIFREKNDKKLRKIKTQNSEGAGVI